MGDFLKLLLDSINYLWPFEIVHQWERGVVYIFGHYWRTVAPGLYPKLPFFTSIHCVAVVPDSSLSATQTITTRDGGTVTFSVISELEVIDAGLSNNRVMDHEEKAHKDLLAAICDILSTQPEGRLEPEKRGGLLRTCVTEVNKSLSDYGMRCNHVEFATFVRNMRAYRLYQQQG